MSNHSRTDLVSASDFSSGAPCTAACSIHVHNPRHRNRGRHLSDNAKVDQGTEIKTQRTNINEVPSLPPTSDVRSVPMARRNTLRLFTTVTVSTLFGISIMVAA